MPHEDQSMQRIRACAHCGEAPGSQGSARVREWWEAVAAAALYGVVLAESGLVDPMCQSGMLALLGSVG